LSSAAANLREYQVTAQTTRTFGRVVMGARHHHLVVDGPVQNGCPGEAPTPPELFLGAVATCGAELVQVIARQEKLPLDTADVSVIGIIDRSKQPRTDLSLFTSVRMEIVLTGTDAATAATLVEGFKRR
jgi:uncharacterized OsmC-like protein